MARTARIVALLFGSALAAACGGGGERGSPAPPVTIAPPPTPPPIPTPPPSPPPSGTLNYEAAATWALNGGARAVIAVRGGDIQFERYANGGSAARGEMLASGTKSFSCVLAAATEDDRLLTLDDPIGSLLPPWAPGGSAPQNEWKQQIRGRDLLSLSSGLTTSGESGPGLNQIDSYAQAVNAASRFAPDTAALYGPNHFQAFGLFFELKSGGSWGSEGVTGGRDPLDYLQARVFDTIGIRPTAWERDIRGKPNLGGGASMTARHWARFGQFMEQFGQWNGQQVVSAARLQRCVTYRSGAFHGYGLAWWLNRPVGTSYQPARDFLPWSDEVTARWTAGGKLAPSAPDDMFAAFGAGQRKLYVIPSQDLVLVRIGGPIDEDRFFQLLYGTGG